MAVLRRFHRQRITLLRDPQRLFSTLVRMDVADRSDHPRRPSPFVAHAKAASVHPAVAAVQLSHPPLAVIGGRAPGNVVVDRPGLRFHVIRMKLPHRAPLRALPNRETGLESIQDLRALGVEHLAGQNVPVPDAIARSRNGERESLFAATQRFVRLRQL